METNKSLPERSDQDSSPSSENVSPRTILAIRLGGDHVSPDETAATTPFNSMTNESPHLSSGPSLSSFAPGSPDFEEHPLRMLSGIRYDLTTTGSSVSLGDFSVASSASTTAFFGGGGLEMDDSSPASSNTYPAEHEKADGRVGRITVERDFPSTSPLKSTTLHPKQAGKVHHMPQSDDDQG